MFDVIRYGVAKMCVAQCSHVVGYVTYVKDTLFVELVIIKGYGMRATTIEGQNAFAPRGSPIGYFNPVKPRQMFP